MEQKLMQQAIDALSGSYAPYSRFHVAAALLCEDGTVYTGVNIENAAYSAAVCAERTAIFQAVNQGQRSFLAIAICGGKEGEALELCPPCGVCRQVMREFCDPETFRIILGRSAEELQVYTLKELLPVSFGPENLKD